MDATWHDFFSSAASLAALFSSMQSFAKLSLSLDPLELNTYRLVTHTLAVIVSFHATGYFTSEPDVLTCVCIPHSRNAHERKTWEKNMERFTNLRVILAQGPC